jgi:hypothetical protein
MPLAGVRKLGHRLGDPGDACARLANAAAREPHVHLWIPDAAIQVEEIGAILKCAAQPIQVCIDKELT